MSTATAKLNDALVSSINRVHAKSKELEQNVLHPALDKGKDIGAGYPVSAAFIALLAALSFIPVACFIGFVAFVALSTLTIAGVVVAATVLGAVCFATFFVVPALLFTTFLALIFTLTLLALFATYRLYLALRTAPTLPAALSRTSADVLALFKGETALVRRGLGISSSAHDHQQDASEEDLDQYLLSTRRKLEEKREELSARTSGEWVKEEGDGKEGLRGE